MENYDDIINLQHYEPKYHRRMKLEARAAQFAPFAALTGYGNAVEETARLTDNRIELNEEEKELLDQKLELLKKEIKMLPGIKITYFIPDNKKSGGKYVTVTGNLKRIDEYKRTIVLENKKEIPINEIIKLEKNILQI